MGVSKKIFSALGASFWSKRKGGCASWALPLDPPLNPDRDCVKFQGLGGMTRF